jgi:methionyl-tRNA formyltransferase
LRIVFFGTPEFAASIFRYLLDGQVEIAAVVTQPDRPKGRSSQKAPSPVKEAALERGVKIPILQPEKGSDPSFLEALEKIGADLYVVVAFGQILPDALLKIPPKGCINIHASLLPKYRGAAPIQRCLLNGEIETGVAIQKMVKQLDAGDVIATAKVEILPDMTYGELEKELCELSKPLLLLVLQSFERGIPEAAPQNHTLATYAPKILPEEGEIHWEKPADEIHNLIRAYSPKPGAWCWIYGENGEKKRVKIIRSTILRTSGAPGTFLVGEGAVACGASALKILEIQPEGKKAMQAAEWIRGLQKPPCFSNR